METVINNTIIEQLNWRYAVKKFDSTRKISAPDLQTLEESLRLAPSSYGLQPWKFLIVQSPEVRKKLTSVS
jgi:nitroreductase